MNKLPYYIIFILALPIIAYLFLRGHGWEQYVKLQTRKMK